jgi:hypothetical protein
MSDWTICFPARETMCLRRQTCRPHVHTPDLKVGPTARNGSYGNVNATSSARTGSDVDDDELLALQSRIRAAAARCVAR